jgi:hypothetical protein
MPEEIIFNQLSLDRPSGDWKAFMDSLMLEMVTGRTPEQLREMQRRSGMSDELIRDIATLGSGDKFVHGGQS